VAISPAMPRPVITTSGGPARPLIATCDDPRDGPAAVPDRIEVAGLPPTPQEAAEIGRPRVGG